MTVQAPDGPPDDSAAASPTDNGGATKDDALDERIVPPETVSSLPSDDLSSSRRKTTTSHGFGPIRFALTLAAGAVLGTLLTSRLSDAEYRRIVNDLASSHRRALSRAKDDSAACRMELSPTATESRWKPLGVALGGAVDATSLCRTRLLQTEEEADEKELEFRRSAVRLMSETNTAYAAGNRLAEKASAKVRVLEGLWSEKLQASEAAAKEQENGMMAAMLQCRSDLETSLGEGVDWTAKYNVQREEQVELEEMFNALQKERDEILKELERRDDERIEHDECNRERRNCEAELHNGVNVGVQPGELKELRLEHRRCTASFARSQSDAEELRKQLVEKRDEMSVEREVRMEQAEELKQCYQTLGEEPEPPTCGDNLDELRDALQKTGKSAAGFMAQVQECHEMHSEVEKGCNAKDEIITGKLEECLSNLSETRSSLSQQQQRFVESNERNNIEWTEQLTEASVRAEEAESAAGYQEMESAAWKEEVDVLTKKVQQRSRSEVLNRFGEGPHHVKLVFRFPDGTEGSIVLEMAPIDLMPHAVQIFLDIIDRGLYINCTFPLARTHILLIGHMDVRDPENNAELNRVMEAGGLVPGGAMLIKEYNDDYPHHTNTVGFNAVGGPMFYVNLMDNSESHGPDEDSEGESCFARVVDGLQFLDKIAQQPVAEDGYFDQMVHIVETQVLEEWN